MGVGALAVVISNLVGFGAGMGVSLPPVQRAIANTANNLMPNQIPSPDDLIILRRREFISKDEYEDLMRKLGFDAPIAEKLYIAATRMLDASDLVVLKWRGAITERQYEDLMGKLGFDPFWRWALEERMKYFPSAPDLIRFAVREVYAPEVVKKFGMDEDLPPKFLEEAKKVGLTKEQAVNYWRAHWALPSATQGYEMLQRLNPEVLKVLGDKYRKMGLDPENIQTDLDTLKLLLRTLDVMPYWRDRLLAISYYPLTRVDLRRIYELGLIDDKELKARLMELGYTSDDADLMVQFYKVYRQRDNRDLTMSMVKEGYKEGLLDREEAAEYLQYLGYDQFEADFILDLVDMDIKREDVKNEIYTIRERFKAGQISFEEARTMLDRLNIKQSYRDRLLAQMQREKKAKFSIPSESVLGQLLKKKLISEEEYVKYMSELGYPKNLIKALAKLRAGRQLKEVD